MNDDSINLNFSNSQYKKYCNVVKVMQELADRLSGLCQTFPLSEERDEAYIVGTFSLFVIGEEELAIIKESLCDATAISIDTLEDQTVSILVAVKRH